jgi:hypothetical protein
MTAARHRPTGRRWTRGEIVVASVLLAGAGSGVALWRPGVLGPIGSLVFSLVIAGVAVGIAASSHRLSPRDYVAGLLLVCTFFVAWYVQIQPYLGPTSDNAEALEIGVQQLVDGQDPWAVQTRLGGIPSPMLGGFLLAAPFVLVAGSVYWQQVVWMGLLLAALFRWEGPRTAFTVGLLFIASAHTRHWVPNQSDNWIVAVAVLLTAWLGRRSLHNESSWGRIITALLFGVALSYRFILWVAVVPLAVSLIREFGWARAARWLSTAGVVTLALSLGPLLVVPETYLAGPVAMASGKVGNTLPGAPWIVAGLTLTVVAWASSRVRSWADVWAATAVSLAAMIAGLVIVRLPGGWKQAVATYETVAYNGTFLILGLVALALRHGREATPNSSLDANEGTRTRSRTPGWSA